MLRTGTFKAPGHGTVCAVRRRHTRGVFEVCWRRSKQGGGVSAPSRGLGTYGTVQRRWQGAHACSLHRGVPRAHTCATVAMCALPCSVRRRDEQRFLMMALDARRVCPSPHPTLTAVALTCHPPSSTSSVSARLFAAHWRARTTPVRPQTREQCPRLQRYWYSAVHTVTATAWQPPCPSAIRMASKSKSPVSIF